MPSTNPTHDRPAPPLGNGLRRLDIGAGYALWLLSPYDASGLPRPSVIGALRGLLAEAGGGVRRVVLGLEAEAWGPQEERHRLTRTLLEELAAHGQVDLQVHTRTSLVARDADLLRRLSANGRVTVAFTVASLDERVNAWLEPGAPSALRRMMAMQALAHAGVTVGLRLSPLLPGTLEGSEVLLERAAHAGACFVELGSVGLPPAAVLALESREVSGASRPRALRRLHMRTGEKERLQRILSEKAMAVGLLPLDAQLPVASQPLSEVDAASAPRLPAASHQTPRGTFQPRGAPPVRRAGAGHPGAMQLALFTG